MTGPLSRSSSAITPVTPLDFYRTFLTRDLRELADYLECLRRLDPACERATTRRLECINQILTERRLDRLSRVRQPPLLSRAPGA
jgi:hypothetical protein